MDGRKKITSEEIKRLVVERLKTMPSGMRISIGGQGSFSKDELLAKVEEGDSIGQEIIQVELEYLRALKKGEIFNEPGAFSNTA